MESKYTLKIRINQSERTERDMEQKRMKKNNPIYSKECEPQSINPLANACLAVDLMAITHLNSHRIPHHEATFTK